MNVYAAEDMAGLGVLEHQYPGVASLAGGDGALVFSIPCASGEREDLATALIVHKCNHFMEALEFIKATLDSKTDAEAVDFLVNNGPALVEKLETVEVI